MESRVTHTVPVAGDGRVRELFPGRGAAAVTLALIVAITIGWWALALYPVGMEAPTWVLRTRAACFGASGSGLPSAGGWVLLVGEPLGMVGVLVAVWGRALRDDLSWLARRWWGKGAMAIGALAVMAGSVAAAERVTGALSLMRGDVFAPRAAAAPIARLDVAAPALVLIDQRGDRFDLASWRGRPVIVTFAFAHCADICPTLVHQLREARSHATRDTVPIVVVTLDPWRDVPARLPHIAQQWALSASDRLLSGSVDEVSAVLDGWGVGRSRDGATGDINHAAVAFLVNADGRLAARLDGDLDRMRELLRAS